MKSFSFYLTMFIIRLKGIKKVFAESPVDYKKLRKQDIHFPKIPHASQFRIKDCLITEIPGSSLSQDLIMFIHGGAFVYGPAKHHWDSVKRLHSYTETTIWMIDYPKAPENKISQISKNIDHVYQAALKKAGSGKIVMAGDSVGATLIAALNQRLIKINTPLPSLLILISPVMDASFNNEKIRSLEKIDPMLSREGALSAKKMCADAGDLEDPSISPINGDFNKFPQTILFISENDITAPDQELLAIKLQKAGVPHEIICGKEMPHIWPLLPVMKESKMAFRNIIDAINLNLNS